MCRAVRCNKCGKTTWAGCGAHVAQVMGPVPMDQRCRCGEKSADAPAGEAGEKQGFWASLFGKKP